MIVAPLLVLAFPSAFAVEPATPEPWLQAVAYGDEDEEEEDDGSTRKKPRRAEDERTIREIVRGFYARANIGAAAYLLNFGNKGNGNAVSAGTMVGLSLGQDFVDNEKQSMAWEVGFVQGIHNGLAWELQAGLCDGASGAAGGYPCTEGDLRTYALQAAYEFSAYPIRRVGIGFRAGGGALYSPFLIDAQAYTEDVIPSFGFDPGIQGSIHPYGFAGPTIEYYTKLSHFSVGIDADVFYALGWDLGLNASASLKYTF